MRAKIQAIPSGGGEGETPLRETRPLALTQNFFWVMVGCLVAVQAVPLVVAWMASTILR